MRKIKLLALSLGFIFISLFAVGCSCNNENKVVNISKIYFSYKETIISDDGIEINQGGSIDLLLKYEPLDATEKEFTIVDYNEDLINVSQDTDTNVFKITAKSEFDESVSVFETVLRVKVNNSDIEPATCKIKVVKEYQQLPAPTDIRFDGTKIEWNAVYVDKFDCYTVNINGNEIIAYDPFINFDTVNMYDEDLIVKVKSNGTFDFYDSEYSEEIKIKKLSKVQNVQILDNQVIGFNLNESANNYDVYINDTAIKTINNTTNQVDISEYIKDAGNYDIYIIANGDNERIDYIEYSSDKSEIVNIKRLDIPNNFKIQNNILSWDAVDYASSYVVSYRKKDGQDQSLTTQFVQDVVESYHYELTKSFIDKLEVGEYEFTVFAKGNGKTILDGGIGQIYSVEKLGDLSLKLQEMLIEKGNKSELLNVITWNKITDNEAYEILINNSTPIIINNKNYIELDQSFDAGLYSIKVKVLGDGETTFSGVYSKEIGVKKLEAVNWQTFNYDADLGQVTFTANYADDQDFEILVNNEKADYFVIQDDISQIDNKDVKIGFNLLNYVENAGDYSIKVKVKNRKYQRNEQDVSNFYGYTDSEYSQEFVVTKLNSPTLNYDGTNITISSLVGSKSYDLKIYKTIFNNGQDQKVFVGEIKDINNNRVVFNDLQFVNNNQSVDLEEGITYEICATLNGQSTNQYKTISSNESDSLKIQILPAPVIIVNSTQEYADTTSFYTSTKFGLTHESVDASSYDYYITNLNNGNVDKLSKSSYDSESGYNNFISKYSNSVYNSGIIVQAIANGKVSETTDGVNFIASKKSEGVKFYQLPVVSIKTIQSDKLIFNKLSFTDYDNKNIQYSIRFMIDEDVVFIDNNITFTTNESQNELEYLLTNAVNHIFSLTNENDEKIYDLDISNYNVKVDIIANGSSLLLSNKISNSISFEKLKNPKLSVTDFNTIINSDFENLTLNDMPGQLVIEKVENSSGYLIYPYLEEVAYGNPIYIPYFNAEKFVFNYQDNNAQGGNYSFKVIALGNDGKVLQSNETQLDAVKYSAPNVSIDDGYIRWQSNYNKGALPDCLFIIKITYNNTDDYYLPYDLNQLDLDNISSIIDLKNVVGMMFPNNLPSGINYQVSIYSVPTNLNQEMNLKSDCNSIYNVTKLPTPSISLIEDGKFYFSEVSGSTGYEVIVNEDKYILYVNGNSITSSVEEAFELSKNSENLFTFNFEKLYGKKSGKYEIKVRAISSTENVVHSSYTVATNTEVLAAPIVTIVNGIIRYNAIDNASNYTIKIYTASYDKNNDVYQKEELINKFTEENINNTTFDFVQQNNNGTWAYESGYYMFEIIANGDGSKFITKTKTDTDSNEKFVYKLRAPANLKIKDGKLAWTTEENVNNLRILAQENKLLNYEITSTDCTYLLNERFASNIYSSIQLQMLGKNEYLNSNISDKIKIPENNNQTYKLSTPQIRTNNGELEIIHNDQNKTFYYELKIGTNIYNIGKDFTWKIIEDETNLKIQLYKVVNGELLEDIGKFLILEGTNDIQIRAIGSYDSDISGWYFNSDYSDFKTVCVLNNVSNIQINNGELSWSNPISNSTVKGNLKLVYTINDNAEENIVDINNINTYHFNDANQYNIYFINVGNTNSLSSGIFALNSKKSSTFRLIKSEKPNKITSELIQSSQTNDLSVKLSVESKENYSYKFVLDDIITIYEGIQNDINLQIVQKQKTINSETKNYNALIINGETIKLNGSDYELGEIYTIKAMYVGSTENPLVKENIYYLSSEYSDKLNGTIPKSPNLNVEEALDENNNSYYTGRVYWEPVTFNNGEEIVDSYIVTTYFSNNIYLIKSIENGIITLQRDNTEYTFTQEDLINSSEFTKSEKTINTTFINADNNGTYIRFIKSLLTSSGSYSSSSICAFNYNVYASGNGTKDNPYVINSFTHFNNVKYNMQKDVYYKLGCDLDFNGKEFKIIGNEIDYFNANFDGNSYSIRNITINSVTKDYVGLFGYVGQDAVIKNVKIVNIQSSNGYYIGGITGYNMGSIENCSVSGQIGTNYSSLSMTAYNGGIVGYNMGRITNCTSNVNILTVSVKGDYSTYAGGIAGYNAKNAEIYNCINNGQIGNNTIASQFAGGLVGENNGNILKSKNTNNVYGVSVANSFESYVGGLVGRNNSTAKIENCLTNGNVNVYYAKSTANLYAGGLVGYNYNGTVKNSMMAINVDNQKLTINGISSVSSNLIIGSIFGYNSTFKNVSNLFIYDNVKVLANNIEIDKIVGSGLEFNNSNDGGVYIIKNIETLNNVINNTLNTWTVNDGYVDNNASGDNLNEEF